MPAAVKRLSGTLRLVELRRIELLTSAVRLHRLKRILAVLRDFVTAECRSQSRNRAVCDTLAIR